MLFAIDIDGTVAQPAEQRLAYIPFFNRVLDLRLSKEQIAAFPDFSAFRDEIILPWMDSPEKKEVYREASKNLQYDPDCQRAAIPLPGAVEGVRLLAERGKVIYVTHRKVATEELTRQWLTYYGFPSPERAYCSEHAYDKPKRAHACAREGEPVVIIDNDIRGVMTGFRLFCTQYRDSGSSLIKRLGFIVYGDQELDPVKTPKIAPVLCLPLKRLLDWRLLVPFLEGDFHELAHAIDLRQSTISAL